MIRLKRVYEPPSQEDGLRVLVDRLWPRALKREAAKIDVWLKDIAPGTALRQWFGHDPSRWAEFERRYRRELAANPEAVAALRALVKANKRLTLLFAAKDSEHNNAVALKNFLARRTAPKAHSAARRAAGR
ncbi:MAG TPA: DUF488 family protein [Stellaceae bacterium]|nr:DUF488 family protein [Stellaceae bacterium]